MTDFGPSWFLDDGTSVTARILYEGCVAEILKHEGWCGFSAHLIAEDGYELMVEFSDSLVAERDRELLAPGALFWHVVEYVCNVHPGGRSQLHFRRMDEEVPGRPWAEAVAAAWGRA